jgi:hypothetical protein
MMGRLGQENRSIRRARSIAQNADAALIDGRCLSMRTGNHFDDCYQFACTDLHSREHSLPGLRTPQFI